MDILDHVTAYCLTMGIVNLLSIGFLFCLVAGNYDEQYIGCYKEDGSNPELGDGIEEASMTISRCLTHCSSKGKTYAATQNGTRCFCGESYGKYGPSKECNIKCPGDNTYYCGGNLTNSIYAACPIGRYGSSCNMECHCANEAPCFLSNGNCPNNNCASGWSGNHCHQTSVSVESLSHYGCFTDARNNGFIEISNNPLDQMTIPLCMDRCRTRFGTYAGLQYMYQCYCGNSSYAANGSSTKCGSGCETVNSNCNCTGSPKDRCGGAWANDVYSVCQFGYYGELCSSRCHCSGDTNCTMETGTCPNAACEPGWSGPACNMRNCSDKNGDCTGRNEICLNDPIGDGLNVPRCRCAQGFNRTMEYENCTDIDECLLGLPDNQCEPSAGTCFNSEGTYSCICKEGYENNGNKACKDIDECAHGMELNECDPSTGQCFNFPGDYNCSCLAGYINNASIHTCQDVDECLLVNLNNECDNETSTCLNTPGSYICQCFPGYKPGENPRQCVGSSDESDVIVGAVVGTLCAILLILAIIAGIYFYRKRRDRSQPSVAKGIENSFYDEIEGHSSSSVAVTAIAGLLSNRMEEEFESVSMEAEHPSDYATDEALRAKNRYKNILPYNHNRVKLQHIGDDPTSDYINASYIIGYRNQRLIASHGPQSATVNDFWRMIWEQDIGMIVMITKCIESGKKKCEQYWPDSRESKQFGTLTVLTVEEDDFADYSIRRLKIDKDGASRTVRQCHFLAWPDHDVPSHAHSLLRFRERVLKSTPENKGIVVHCSAGVGRTGTFIAIDNLLCEAEETSPPRIDALRCLRNLRDQRMHMIQTQAQYNFIYLAISEAYTAGQTLFTSSEFTERFASIRSNYEILERQFKTLEKMKIYMTDDDKYDALLPVNRNKNRDMNIVPAGRDRVFLLSREKGRNDYINAVFCQSFRSKEAYILTQMPLPETVLDFWNMICDYNCQFVALFDEDQNPAFIPTLKEPLVFQNVIVYWMSEVSIAGGVSYSVRLVSKRKSQKDIPQAEESVYVNTESGTIVTVNIITAKQHGMFDHQSMLALYNTMRAKYRSDQKSRIPIVVMCMNGCTYSSVYVCMSNIFDIIDSQNEVDVFQTVYNMRMTRPFAIESMFFYEQLYALTLLKLQSSQSVAQYGHSSDIDAIYVNN